MGPPIAIRSETVAAAGAIAAVTVAAFQALETSSHTESFIVEALDAANALTRSLVAEVDGRVVGQIAFSPVSISDGTPHGCGRGPVAVLPERERKGLGSALIREGLSRSRALGAKGCCLVGYPQHCRKFGVRNVSGLFRTRCSAPCPSTGGFRRAR